MGSETPFDYALSSNAAWAGYKSHQNPKFFPTMAQGQSPSILWLGCSDSRVPETTVLGLQPGDVFVHRNIANIVSPTDINSSAVIEYAVVHLKVSHIVLCGHTSCGGAAAALGGSRVGGVLDTWLAPLKALTKLHDKELKGIKEDAARAGRLAELNVAKGVEVLMGNVVVEEAVRERGLKVHGVVYDIACGKIRDLGVGNCNEEEEGVAWNDGAADDAKGGKEKELVKGAHGMLVFGKEGATLSTA
ncbi:hypothetical protein SBOR_0239 [Sclerotinia borealis F-4128]|uniref:Carbonic anhydrase n=1 Tax=Sclerotinia borealis (strain F-4128) TaxID=1432307 RepID=W9CXI6_SCLBF|nr:hypothetical protein SBOR_0239 [Sclerotinia borealis F-4128]